jgi:CRISPR-associated protein Csm4
MNAFPTYRLRFRSPLRIGERGVGLEVSRAWIPADTLFSAVCSAWRELYGTEALEKELLPGFTVNDGENAPFFLTSAFPFAGSVRFFPRPFAKPARLQISEADAKAFRRVKLVSEQIFASLISNQPLGFEPRACLNGGEVWLTKDERKRLADLTDDSTGDIVLWQNSVVPRVTLDRISSASAIWHLGSVRFAQGCGLWFAARFTAAASDGLRHRFESVLRLLGDTGLGGERGAGHGLFDLDAAKEESLPNAESPGRFVTLSPCCPKDALQAEALTGDGASYELIPRRGWIGSPEAGNLRRKMVWMFAEGSVLNGNGSQHHGKLVDVKLDICPHDVWRYGYAFPVEVKS